LADPHSLGPVAEKISQDGGPNLLRLVHLEKEQISKASYAKKAVNELGKAIIGLQEGRLPAMGSGI